MDRIRICTAVGLRHEGMVNLLSSILFSSISVNYRTLGNETLFCNEPVVLFCRLCNNIPRKCAGMG